MVWFMRQESVAQEHQQFLSWIYLTTKWERWDIDIHPNIDHDMESENYGISNHNFTSKLISSDE